MEVSISLAMDKVFSLNNFLHLKESEENVLQIHQYISIESFFYPEAFVNSINIYP